MEDDASIRLEREWEEEEEELYNEEEEEEEDEEEEDDDDNAWFIDEEGMYWFDNRLRGYAAP